MTFFAGIDGGQSSTRAVIGDEHGRITGRGSAGPADEVGETPQSTRLHDALLGALREAAAKAGLPPQTRFAQIVAGVSGFEGRVTGAAPQLPADALTLVHDSAIAHAGALGGQPGVVVVAGTGSVAYAVNESGGTALAGGWGYLFGDEGSAFWLAREALSAAMRDHDAGQAADITPAALEFFRAVSLRALARAFYAGEISRAALASFAPQVVRAAECGDARAAGQVRAAARALAGIATGAMERAGMRVAHVAFGGGLTKNPTVRESIAQCMRDSAPHCTLVAPKFDAATGALLLAYRAAGLAPGISAA